MFSQFGRVGVFKIGHKDFGAAVERVDDHFAICGTGDFHAAVLQVSRRRRDAPTQVFTDGGGFRQEVRHVTRIDIGLPGFAGLQKRVAADGELAREIGEEGDGVRCQDRFVFWPDFAADVDAGGVSFGWVMGRYTLRIECQSYGGQLYAKSRCRE